MEHFDALCFFPELLFFKAVLKKNVIRSTLPVFFNYLDNLLLVQKAVGVYLFSCKLLLEKGIPW
jgi:hypothetical protein